MSNKTTPQQIGGTITIPNGDKIQMKPDSIKNNESNISSSNFIKEFKKAITEGIFNNENGQRNKATR